MDLTRSPFAHSLSSRSLYLLLLSRNLHSFSVARSLSLSYLLISTPHRLNFPLPRSANHIRISLSIDLIVFSPRLFLPSSLSLTHALSFSSLRSSFSIFPLTSLSFLFIFTTSPHTSSFLNFILVLISLYFTHPLILLPIDMSK